MIMSKKYSQNLAPIFFQLRSRHADEYRNLEEDYRQRHHRLREDHEQEIQNCIRQYFAKNNQEQPEDLSLHRHDPGTSGIANSMGGPLGPSAAVIAAGASGLHSAGASTSSFGQQSPMSVGPPNFVRIASPNFLMPPAPHLSQSSHSSTEDCSGCSNEVKHKLHVSKLLFGSERSDRSVYQ